MDLGFWLAFLVAFHLLPCLSGNNSSSPTCPENFVCSNLGPFKFPFSNFTRPDCGLCMVDCHTHPSPRIKLDRWSEQWFDVQGGLQSNIIKLHDPFFQNFLDDKNCDTFFFPHIYLPNSTSISYSIKSNITLFKCIKYHSKDIVDHFTGYQKTKPCGDFEVYYKVLNYNDSQFVIESSPIGCSGMLLPVRSVNDITEHPNLFDLLTADFDLEWHLSDECNECHREGGQCKSNETNQFHCDRGEKSNSSSGKNKPNIILLTVVSAGGIALLVILVFCCGRKFSEFWKCKTEKNQDLETFIKNYGSLAPKRYCYSEVKKVTNSFGTKLGQGGYGSVYKGKLKDGSLVAVKVLKESKGNGEEFINEVASISRTSHVNIVNLLGFCVQGRKKALIYQFMANGSLEKFIYREQSSVRQLEWPTSYRIAVGIARGLEYLHRGCNTRILHFDIKPHNILLDENFCPKISDFGLAKLCTRKESMISTMAARGTIGYIAPEVVCKNIGLVSPKSDVYSYGMMVLEMVGGRKNVDVGVDRSSEIYFPHWIYTRLCQGEELGLSGIKDEEENEQARKMLLVSLWCIQTNPSDRPSMNKVLEMLEGNIEALEMPPKPFLYPCPPASSKGSRTQSGHSAPIAPSAS